jgi:hypothetical protein
MEDGRRRWKSAEYIEKRYTHSAMTRRVADSFAAYFRMHKYLTAILVIAQSMSAISVMMDLWMRNAVAKQNTGDFFPKI